MLRWGSGEHSCCAFFGMEGTGDELIRMAVPDPYADDVPVSARALARLESGNIC
jgi:hypothetical protein